MPASSSYLNQPLRSLVDATRQRQENPLNKPAHTPEPWSHANSRYQVDAAKIVDAQGELVADTYSDRRRVSEQAENLRRIVACVNACAGIPTEALESGVLRRFIAYAACGLHGSSQYAQDGRSLLTALGAEFIKTLYEGD